MKSPIFLLLLLLVGFNSHSQDQLFKTDNTKLEVKVTEVSPELIKYKLFNNLNGPQYVLNRSEVVLILYANGSHELITVPKAAVSFKEYDYDSEYDLKKKQDSLDYHKYSESISFNFMNLFNLELGIAYQKEFFDKHFSVIVPLSIGLGKPGITQSVYYNNNNINNFQNSVTINLQLEKKLFEFGLGFNYVLPSKTAFSYYLGPVVKYMQYSCTTQFQSFTNQGQSITNEIENDNLGRITGSITNGVLLRTKSRLILNAFLSLGMKYDKFPNEVINPNTGQPITLITKPTQFYVWLGFMTGFCF